MVLLSQLVGRFVGGELLPHLSFAELVLFIEALQILVQGLHQILVGWLSESWAQLVLVWYFFSISISFSTCHFLLELVAGGSAAELVSGEQKRGEESLQLVSFGPGLQNLELLLLKLVLEFSNVAALVRPSTSLIMFIPVHKVENFIHVLLCFASHLV